jgi:hypothetical protein
MIGIVAAELLSEHFPGDVLGLPFAAYRERLVCRPCVEVERERRALEGTQRANIERYWRRGEGLPKLFSELNPAIPQVVLAALMNISAWECIGDIPPRFCFRVSHGFAAGVGGVGLEWNRRSRCDTSRDRSVPEQLPASACFPPGAGSPITDHEPKPRARVYILSLTSISTPRPPPWGWG